MSASDEILGVVGPSGAGKTALAMRIAEVIGGEIVSCDSMQIYRQFDIGSAKPTADEQRRVPHHLIDVAAPDEAFSAARYAQLVDQAIGEIRARGRRVIVVGGTGLYLRALRFGLFDAPGRDDVVRTRLRNEEHERPGILHLKLRAADPQSAAKIAPRDLVRLIRALEVFELTGTPISAHHAAHDRLPRHAMRVMVLDPAESELVARISARAEVMLSSGLVDETRRISGEFGRELRPLSSVGYGQVMDYLRGTLSAEKLAPAIAMATRKYAKRQRTWFRKEPGAVHYADASALFAGAMVQMRYIESRTAENRRE